MNLNLENLLGDEEHGTLTPKTNSSANTRPGRHTDTATTTIRLIVVYLAGHKLREPKLRTTDREVGYR